MPSIKASLLGLLALAALVPAAPSTDYRLRHRQAMHARLAGARHARALSPRACKVRAPLNIASDRASMDVAASSSAAAAAAAAVTSTVAPYVDTAAAAPAPSSQDVPAPAPAPAPSSSEYVAPAPAPSDAQVEAQAQAYSPPASPAPAYSGAAPSGKCGVAMTGLPESAAYLFSGKASWVYNWSPYNVDSYASAGLEFVPMLWAGDEQHKAMWYANLPKFASWGVKYVLAFNEPEQNGQSNMSPEWAADSYRNDVVAQLNAQGLGGSVQIVGPALTSTPGVSIPWQQSFMANLGDQAPQIMALHWYGTDPAEMIAYLQEFHSTFNRPIWVTEFACHDFTNPSNYCDQGKTDNLFYTVKAFMDSTDWVHRYAWFGALGSMAGLSDANRLVDASGSYLTGLGNSL